MTYQEFIDEWDSPQQYVIVHTSGSTGAPKEIRLSKSVMSKSAMRTIKYFGITHDWHLHSCISPDYIGGKMVAVRALIADTRFSYEPPTNTPVISVDGEEIDMVSVVPSQMVHILDNTEEFSHVRRYLIGGAPLPMGMTEAILAQKIEAWESYGMTETASHIAIRKVGYDSSFIPLPGITIYSGENDCLIIEGATELPIITNDIVDINSDGSFNIIGRIDNIINSGGKKIIPEEIEKKIHKILNIDNPLILTGEPDRKWGTKAVLYIERLPVSATECKEMMRRLRERLQGWECPKEIYIVDTLARTPNGKIKRR